MAQKGKVKGHRGVEILNLGYFAKCGPENHSPLRDLAGGRGLAVLRSSDVLIVQRRWRGRRRQLLSPVGGRARACLVSASSYVPNRFELI